MQYIARLLLGVILSGAVAYAEEYRMIVPFPSGNQTDIVARMLQASIDRNTPDHLIIENIPGAETAIGATHFKNTKSIDVIMGSGSQTIFNPLLKDNLQYTDQDFNHVIYIGTSVGLWIVRSDSKIQTPRDLLNNMPDLVGGYSHSYNYNAIALAKEKTLKPITIVPYKGTNEIIVDLLNGSLPIAVVALNSNLIQLVKTGKIHIIGNTYKTDITVDDIFIPSANKQLGISQFNGFLSLDLQPQMKQDRAEKIKKLLWDAVQDPQVTEGLKNLYLLSDATNDAKVINNYYDNYRFKVKLFLSK